MGISRRQFLQAAIAGGAVAVIPRAIVDRVRAAGGSADTRYFLSPGQWATCGALCARIVPTGSDPKTDPGATEAGATLFVDRYLAAFELPTPVADNPAIWLRGPFSGRNPEPDFDTGGPSTTYPPDSMLGSDGQAHFLTLSRIQELRWRATLYGPDDRVVTAAAAANPAVARWLKLVKSGTIPGPPAGGQRHLYAAGLDAYDAWSKQTWGVPYAKASSEQQDLLLAAAANPVIGAVPAPSPPAPPPAASALTPTLMVHTFQACYGLPEYRWRHDNPLWKLIGYDGDTQPLGNSVYDANLPGAGVDEGPNAGFGMPGVYQPVGGYRQYRPVSYLDPAESAPLSAEEETRWVPVIRRAVDRRRS